MRVESMPQVYIVTDTVQHLDDKLTVILDKYKYSDIQTDKCLTAASQSPHGLPIHSE